MWGRHCCGYGDVKGLRESMGEVGRRRARSSIAKRKVNVKDVRVLLQVRCQVLHRTKRGEGEGGVRVQGGKVSKRVREIQRGELKIVKRTHKELKEWDKLRVDGEGEESRCFGPN